LVQIEDQAINELADIAIGRVGRMRIAYLLHADVVRQGKLVGQFRRSYPLVEVTTSAGHSRTNLDILSNGDADAAFIELPAEIPDGITVQSIGPHYQLMLALPLDHELAKLTQVPVAALRSVPLILSPASENPAKAAALKRWLRELTKAELQIAGEEPVDQALEAVATSGTAVGLVSWWRASAGAAGVVFKPLNPAPMVELAIAHRSDDPNPMLKNLLDVSGEITASALNEIVFDGERL
jgi:DNA-binding transcriptional LysR family regulator